MSTVAMFLSGLGVTLLLSLSVVAYMQIHLKQILIDLCGTPERAKFWTAFSNVTLVLVPLIFALNYRPASGSPEDLVFEVGTQLERALIGLVASVIAMGVVLSAFIPRRPSQTLPEKDARPT
jgi:hypothetical protein